MKFGIVLPSYLPQATIEGMRETALLAEELGFDTVWTTDHVIIGKADRPAATAISGQSPYESVFEALNVLSWLAGLTSRVKLGVSVLIMPQRNPIVVAKEVATIDALSGGRVILGLGAGWSSREFGYLNADFAHRGAILDEGIRVLRSLWTAPDQPFQGTFFNFEGHTFAPPPVQPSGPPIWIGGQSRAALRRAATLGDAWHSGSMGGSPEAFAAAANTIRALKGEREVALTLRCPVRNEAGLRPSPKGDIFVMGGSAADIRADVLRLAEAGCSDIALNFWEGDQTAQLEGMRFFAGEVIPHV